MEIKDYVKQFLETYGTSGKAERVTCKRVTKKWGWQTSAVNIPQNTKRVWNLIILWTKDDRNNALAEQYRELAAQEKNVIFGGRLAEYKYYDMAPIMEKVLGMDIV